MQLRTRSLIESSETRSVAYDPPLRHEGRSPQIGFPRR